MNNQKKAERACRRFTKARKRQNYFSPFQGYGEGRTIDMGDDIDMTVVRIEELKDGHVIAHVHAVLDLVNVVCGHEAPEADAIASRTAELAMERGRKAVTIDDLADVYIEVKLCGADEAEFLNYLARSLDLFGDGIAFDVSISVTEAAAFASVIRDEREGHDIDEGNVLPLAQAKFEAMVAA